MVIGIDMGHTLSGVGTGAVGIVKETDKNREVGNRLIAMLREKGHTVVNCTVNYSSNDLRDRARNANAQHLDLFISLHLNAHNGTADGVETYIYNGSYNGKEANRIKAKKINDEVAASCSFRNRGVKEANYYVLRETIAPACLIELGFCDSKIDMQKWNTEKIAKALFKGITGTDYAVNITQPSNDIEEKEKFDMKNLVCYCNAVDKRAAEYLADYLQCPCIDATLPFTYKGVAENIIAVGGNASPVGFSSYTTKYIQGKDRYDTLKEVLKFIGKL